MAPRSGGCAERHGFRRARMRGCTGRLSTVTRAGGMSTAAMAAGTAFAPRPKGQNQVKTNEHCSQSARHRESIAQQPN
jgi:hypothetical protein